MKTGKTLVIVDYFRRYFWAYLVGVIIHFWAAYGLARGLPRPLFGLLIGSAYLLGFELARSGSATVRNYLALPISAKDLARAWRFVGLVFPVLLFHLVFMLGIHYGRSTGGDKLSAEQISAFSGLQIGIFGLTFFALTGLPKGLVLGQTLLGKIGELFFAILWILATLVALLGGFLSDHEPLQKLLFQWPFWTILTFVTVAGYFRADTLVTKRSSEEKFASSTETNDQSRKPTSWRGLGGLLYFVGIFGGHLLVVFFAGMFGTWIIINQMIADKEVIFASFGSQLPLNLFLTATGLLSMFQIFPMLRSVRILPMKLTELTSFIVFWPALVIGGLCFLGMASHAILAETSLDWVGFVCSVAGVSTILPLIPVILRFGMNLFTLLGPVLFMLVVSGISNINLRTSGWTDPADLLIPQIVLLSVLIFTWIFTYLVLQSSHPWRSNRFVLGIKRKRY